MQYEALLNNIEYMVWSVRIKDFALTYYNDAFTKQFPLTFCDSTLVSVELGSTPSELMSDEQADNMIAFYNKTIISGRFQTHIRTSKNQRDLLLSFSTYTDGDQVLGISVFADDVTERFQYRDQLIASNTQLSKKYMIAIEAISKLSALRDPYTASHQKRVQYLSCAIAQKLNLSQEQIEHIAVGALIHDIGKIYIPSDILNKPGSLTSLEYKLLQTHVAHARETLQSMELPKVVIDMVCQHHERLDGSGYPLGLQGDEIHFKSRIIAVADVVEAMLSHRPYRPALEMTSVIDELYKHKGSKYDASVVDACLTILSDAEFCLPEL